MQYSVQKKKNAGKMYIGQKIVFFFVAKHFFFWGGFRVPFACGEKLHIYMRYVWNVIQFNGAYFDVKE